MIDLLHQLPSGARVLDLGARAGSFVNPRPDLFVVRLDLDSNVRYTGQAFDSRKEEVLKASKRYFAAVRKLAPEARSAYALVEQTRFAERRKH